MTCAAAVSELDRVASGKVRDIYSVDGRLLLVASDRISAFDVVLPDRIPDKGRVLTGMSAWWFDRTEFIVSNHLMSTDWRDFPGRARDPVFTGRAMLCDRLEMLPIECVVRGYLSGSGWRDYLDTGAVCGVELPRGMVESQELPEPIFTPAVKAKPGDHDENVGPAEAAAILGSQDVYTELSRISLELYRFGRERARDCGIVLADTKFEFGTNSAGSIVLADELLTPDSSRYWPLDEYRPGGSQPSFDKQYVRDWLVSSGWDKAPPGPRLPADVVIDTRKKYVDAYERITGLDFSRWTGERA